MTRAEFIEHARRAAVRASAKSGFAAGVTVAQAALESNWGQSQLSRTANNYFGLKAHGNHPAMEFRTCEFGEQGKNVVVAKFAVYTSMEECFECRDRQIMNGNAYENAREAKSDPEKFVREMAKHWATDPKYSEKLLRIYRENGFDKWDE
jgi:flagellum-specific peptidoglycan hydrolase FlgJ